MITLEQSVHDVRQLGEGMRNELRSLSHATAIPFLDLARAHGALCLDISDGPEIVALGGLANPLIVCEVPRSATAGERVEEQRRSDTVKTISEGLPVTILEEFPHAAIRTVMEAMPQVSLGLITRFNTFPDFLGSHALVDLVEHAAGALAPEGCIVISAIEQDEWATRRYFEEAASAPMKGVILSTINRDHFNVLGRTFLIGRKTG